MVTIYRTNSDGEIEEQTGATVSPTGKSWTVLTEGCVQARRYRSADGWTDDYLQAVKDAEHFWTTLNQLLQSAADRALSEVDTLRTSHQLLESLNGLKDLNSL